MKHAFSILRRRLDYYRRGRRPRWSGHPTSRWAIIAVVMPPHHVWLEPESSAALAGVPPPPPPCRPPWACQKIDEIVANLFVADRSGRPAAATFEDTLSAFQLDAAQIDNACAVRTPLLQVDQLPPDEIWIAHRSLSLNSRASRAISRSARLFIQNSASPEGCHDPAVFPRSGSRQLVTEASRSPLSNDFLS